MPGCTEHHLKLASILDDARKKHKSLAVCWLDLANAYGSVHHSLIRFAFEHYQAPPQLVSIIQTLYSGLLASFRTVSWSTPIIPLGVGVYQGDPLSVVIFNTVINTLVDTIQTRQDLGYNYSLTQRPVNLLQYANDTCLVANSSASCQHLLGMMNEWLTWSGMKAKISKCTSLGLQASTRKKINPGLTLGSASIPFAEQPVEFLGMRVEIPHNQSKSKSIITTELKRMFQRIDLCPLTMNQKLHLYRFGVCPRLSWLLTIEELPISWVEKNADAIATHFLKKWSRLARSANVAPLYLSQKLGGFNLPLISSLHKKLQVSRQGQLVTSQDSCVRLMAEKMMIREATLSRRKFRPGDVITEVMQSNPNFTRKSLTKVVKALMHEEDQEGMKLSLQALPKQGHMSRCTDEDGAAIWGKALQCMGEEHI